MQKWFYSTYLVPQAGLTITSNGTFDRKDVPFDLDDIRQFIAGELNRNQQTQRDFGREVQGNDINFYALNRVDFNGQTATFFCSGFLLMKSGSPITFSSPVGMKNPFDLVGIRQKFANVMNSQKSVCEIFGREIKQGDINFYAFNKIN